MAGDALVDVRCRYCSKLQWKQDRDALKAGKRIEVKCERCNQYSVHVGPTDQKPVEAPRHQAATEPAARGQGHEDGISGQQA